VYLRCSLHPSSLSLISAPKLVDYSPV
jgi:hypothetical protein